MLPRRSARNRADGLGTSARPCSVISNTPISSVAPKRFLTPRRMRNWWPRSPSKYSTASTMCSSTRGPASAPSLVTWPTSTRAKPRCLARRISSKRQARTCATRAGRGFDGVEPHGLDRVDHHQAASRRLFQRRGDVAHVDGGGQLQRRVGQAEPAGAQADLVDRFLAGDVQHPAPGPRQGGGGLQQQGGLADAGIAAHQHGGGGDQAAAQHAVQLGDAGLRPGRRGGRALQPDEGDAARAWRRGRAGAGVDRLLDDGVPLAARLAAAGPFRVTAPQDWQT